MLWPDLGFRQILDRASDLKQRKKQFYTKFPNVENKFTNDSKYIAMKCISVVI